MTSMLVNKDLINMVLIIDPVIRRISKPQLRKLQRFVKIMNYA